MHSFEPSSANALTPHLLLEPEDEKGIDRDFLVEAFSRFPEDDSVQAAIVGAVEELSRQLSRMTMNDDFKAYVFVSLARPSHSRLMC